MLKIKKETVKTTKLELTINVELKKELEFYLKVAKHNEFMSKETKLNELIEEALRQLVASADYLTLKADYEAIDKAKREAMRKAKAEQRKKAHQLIEEASKADIKASIKEEQPQPKKQR